MCGISGSFGEYDRDFIMSSLSELKSRGPDNTGILSVDSFCLMGSTRLCMVDRDIKSSQPFLIDGYCLVYNGEIYNHSALRLEHLKEIQFETESDTETLARLLERYGPKCLPWLEGMYAFAFYSMADKSLVLARDKFGKKPLYFSKEINKTASRYLIFSSLPSCLSKAKKKIDDAILLTDFMHLGYLIDPESAFENVFAVLPGESMLFQLQQDGSITQSAYGKNTRYEKIQKRSTLEDDALSSPMALRKKILEAIEIRLDNHNEVALSLSGGIDSTVIAIGLRELGRRAKCFSVYWPDSDKSRYNFDHDRARNIALSLEHEFSSVPSFPPEDLIKYLELYLFAMKEPNGNPTGLSMIPLYETIKQSGIRLALTGDGADEIFGGYARYRKIAHFSIPYRLGISIPKVIANTRVPQLRGWDSWAFWHRTYGLDELSKVTNLHENDNKIREQYEHLYMEHTQDTNSLVSAVMKLDREIWLAMESNRRLDRVSMFFSVEARSPFQDFRLNDLLAKRTANEVKRDLGKKRLIEAFPEVLQFVDKEKRGFVSPIGHWLRINVKEVDTAIEYLSGNSKFAELILDIKPADVFSGDFLKLRKIWNLLVLSKWEAISI